MFLGQFESADDVKREFEVADAAFKGVKILLAYYSYEDYSGDAFVLFRKDRKLFEVNGSHCSCHGLEGQWEPESTSIPELRLRMERGSLGETPYGPQLREVLDALKRPRGSNKQSALTA